MPKCRYCDFTIDIFEEMSDKAKDAEWRNMRGHMFDAHPTEMTKIRSSRMEMSQTSASLNRQLNRKLVVDGQGFDQFDRVVPLDRLFKR